MTGGGPGAWGSWRIAPLWPVRSDWMHAISFSPSPALIQILCHLVTAMLPQLLRNCTDLVGPDLVLLAILEGTQNEKRERDIA